MIKEEVITVISDYADVGSLKCSNEYNKISIAIPLDVKQQVDEDFDIVVDYRYDNFDIEPPTCSLKFVSNNIVFSSKEDNVGVYTYGIFTSSEEDYNKKDLLSVSENTFYGYVMDLAGNKGKCNIKIERVYDECLTGSNTCHAGLVTDYSNCIACKACNYTEFYFADGYNLPTCKRLNNCSWQGGGYYCSTTLYGSNCNECGCVYGKRLSDCATGSNTCRGGFKYVVK